MKTSEQHYGLMDAPDYQCPRIDSIISDIADAQILCRDIQKLDEGYIDDILNAASDAEDKLSTLEDELETMRTEVDELREWGNQWKNLAKAIIDRNEFDVEQVLALANGTLPCKQPENT